jgi:alpha-tubulin suppressor-like RCC1 family protein
VGRVDGGGDQTNACATTFDGVAYCWGSNTFGQLGDGTSGNDRTRPVRVAGGLAFSAVASNGYHTCGITTRSRAYCWGFNVYGGLGDGTTEERDTPVPVVSPR